MEILKEALITGILLAGLLNTIYGVPFVGAYSISGYRSALYWTSLFLLGNFSAYLFIFILGLYQIGNALEWIGELKPLFGFFLSLLSLLTGLIILLATLSLNKFLLNVTGRIILSGGLIYLFGFFMGLYLGKSAIGMYIYLRDMSLSKLDFALAGFVFSFGSFFSPPLYIMAGLFRIFPRYIRTTGERRFWDFLASVLLLISGLCFFFWG